MLSEQLSYGTSMLAVLQAIREMEVIDKKRTRQLEELIARDAQKKWWYYHLPNGIITKVFAAGPERWRWILYEHDKIPEVISSVYKGHGE